VEGFVEGCLSSHSQDNEGRTNNLKSWKCGSSCHYRASLGAILTRNSWPFRSGPRLWAIRFLQQIAGGNRNRDIAEKFFITEETVKVHRRDSRIIVSHEAGRTVLLRIIPARAAELRLLPESSGQATGGDSHSRRNGL